MKQHRLAVFLTVAAIGLMTGLSFADSPGQLDEPFAKSVGQPGWRLCSKCGGLHFIDNPSSPTLGPCPAGGQHSYAGSGSYKMIVNVPDWYGQHGWRFCNKCRQLFFGGNPSQGACPAGGEHDSTGSGDYCLIHQYTCGIGQPEWRWCENCQSLHFPGGGNPSVCPAGGQHSTSGSGNYTMLYQTSDANVWGIVKDSLGGLVVGAQVTIRGNTTKKVRTAANGTYFFLKLPAGRYYLSASKKNVGSAATKKFKLVKGETGDYNLTLQK